MAFGLGSILGSLGGGGGGGASATATGGNVSFNPEIDVTNITEIDFSAFTAPLQRLVDAQAGIQSVKVAQTQDVIDVVKLVGAGAVLAVAFYRVRKA